MTWSINDIDFDSCVLYRHIFREDGDIDSFFFAFIDDHYDYHTSNDTYENLDRETLQHQGSYLLPLLHYFADADLSALKAAEDKVYVNAPLVKMITYPFAWVIPLLVIAIVLFFALLFYGIHQGRLRARDITRGFGAFLLTLIICGVIGYFGWTLLKIIYPQYTDIQHGFTYNGHWYIAFFVLLSIAICFRVYKKFKAQFFIPSFFVAPLTFWLLINIGVAVYLKGAAYWIIPVYFGLLAFFVTLRQEKPSILLLSLLSVPAIFFFSPLIQFFPVGLGLKMLVASSLFVVLTFGLLLPVFSRYRWKNILSVTTFIMAIGCFIIAHAKSDYTADRQRPNSLLYYNDHDTNESYWVSYDTEVDEWTRGYLGDAPEDAAKYIASAAGSKYNNGYNFAAKAPQKTIKAATMQLTLDSISDSGRETSVTIQPQRNTHELFVYVNKENEFDSLVVNGKVTSKDTAVSGFVNRTSNRLLRYYVTDNDSLVLHYKTKSAVAPEIMVMEFSYDLFTHPQFSINKRPDYMMPMPFINTDAIVTKKTFNIDTLKDKNTVLTIDTTLQDE